MAHIKLGHQMSRPDLSPHLVHFTKGVTYEEAFQTLRTMVAEQRLLGGINNIKGQHRCVCFTEAPLWSVEGGLANPSAYKRYSPFGIMFDKLHVYALGGRPVIYQADEEYVSLPDSHKWRHVKYEPCAPDPIDWTWEREWRLKCDFLNFTPVEAVLVVPTREYAERLYAEHEAEQDMQVLQYSQIMNELFANQYRENFPWRIAVLQE